MLVLVDVINRKTINVFLYRKRFFDMYVYILFYKKKSWYIII